MIKTWFKNGNSWIWLNGGAIAVSILLVLGLLLLIASHGLSYFWPKIVFQANYLPPGAKPDKVAVLGEIHSTESVLASRLRERGIAVSPEKVVVQRYLVKINRVGSENPYRNYLADYMTNFHYPQEVMVVERRSGGNYYGFPQALQENGKPVEKGLTELNTRLQRANTTFSKIQSIEKSQMGALNYQKERLTLAKLKLDFYKEKDKSKYDLLASEFGLLEEQYKTLTAQLTQLRVDINRDQIVLRNQNKEITSIPLGEVIRVYQPNQMGFFGKTSLYFAKFWEFISDDPREANTEGGIFPALFGTIVIVILMSIVVAPIGVIAAIYLREYAKQGFITRMVRISVNNLAGVPSIVYGVFGLGFFVYVIGGNLDAFFFPERAAYKTTFGSPALIWAALTLALLTLPVVIVATEEGLSRVPRAIREGSLALGATKAETLWRTVLPMASPGMMTGLILAIARAAGEVAPLMLVGVVKFSPSPPIDLNAPFIHFDRTIMHVGFHIHDVGFQSPNSEAAAPLVYATAFILVMVIVILNIAAVSLRNRLREKYRSLEH